MAIRQTAHPSNSKGPRGPALGRWLESPTRIAQFHLASRMASSSERRFDGWTQAGPAARKQAVRGLIFRQSTDMQGVLIRQKLSIQRVEARGQMAMIYRSIRITGRPAHWAA